MDNREIARTLERIGQILEIRGESPFKARAYYNAARTIETLSEDINTVVAEGRLSSLPGFGETLTYKVGQLVSTGRMDYLDEIMEGVPPGLLGLLEIADVGPKKARLFHEKLGVTSVDDLEAAARAGRVAALAGMGPKSQAKILSHIEQYRRHKARRLLSEALPAAERVLEQARALPGVRRASLAGSIRRHLETIGDIDVLVSAEDGAAAVEAFTQLEGVEEVVAAGPTKGSVILAAGIRTDLRVVEDRSYAAAQHYFTGSKEHNVRMRQLAKDRGWKLNEYGLFDGEVMLASKDEAELFGHFGMGWIEPELRENMGEIEAALEGRLPELIAAEDIRGLIHVHSNYSDGALSIGRIAELASERGYGYFTLSDHSKAVVVANGLDESRQRAQWRELDAVRHRHRGLKIFRSTEADIRRDGSIDWSDEMLDEFDCVIAAVHSSFTMSSREMTERIIRGVSHPRVDMLAHPTGRRLLEREPYAVDVERVLEACAKHGVAVEIDGDPARLDLDWRYARAGKSLGVKFTVSLDAHSERDFDNLPYGIYAARKGWLSSGDVLNCMSAAEFGEWLASRRKRR